VIALLNNTIAPSSKASYVSGYKLFTSFATLSGFNINSSHLSLQLILRFIAFCHGIRKVQSSTIRSYLSAIRLFRIQAGFKDPFLDSHGTVFPQIGMILRGTRRVCPNGVQQRKPLTLDILIKLTDELRKGVFNPYIDSLMLTALTTAFWGFCRSGELFPNHFSPHLNITIADVTLDDDLAVIHLKASKTDVERRGVDIRLFRTRTAVCAVTSLRRFLLLRPINRSDTPLFCSPNGQPFTRRTFVSNLKHLLVRAGISPTSYSGHSLRIGAATSAAAAGIPDHLIQVLGRWSSLSYLRYIRIDSSIIQNAQVKISNFSS
jgi:integrase